MVRRAPSLLAVTVQRDDRTADLDIQLLDPYGAEADIEEADRR